MTSDRRRPAAARTAPPLLALLLFAAPPAAAAPVDEPCAAGRERAVAAAREMAEALREAAGIPGLAIAVGVGDGIVWSQGFGLADLEAPAPAAPDGRFRAASVSKVLTAAVLARLAARGEIDLGAPVGAHLPDLPPALRPITLRQLAGHLGGIRHYRREDFVPSPIDHRHFDSLGEALALFADDELVAAPGAEYRYSTFGYTLLGAALEAATGRPFPALLETEVVRPLGLQRTGIDDPAAILPGRAALYERTRDGGLARAGYVDPSYKWPGGGLLTSPEDLVRFGLAHLGDGYLPPAMRAELFAPQATAAGEPTGVGLAWRVGEDWRGRRVYHHSGSMEGARSSLLLYPEHRLAIALASNLGGAPREVETTLQMLAEPFLEAGGCGREAAPWLTTGAYRLEARLDGEPGEGFLLLASRGEDVGGLLTLPAPVANALAALGLPAPAALRVVRVLAGPRGPALVIAWPLGLLPLAVEPIGEGALRGRLEAAGRTLDLLATPLAAVPSDTGGKGEAKDGEAEAPAPG